MTRNLRRFFKILALALIVSTGSCHAQFNAGIQGTVQDQKGAVVPNATVTLVNDATGIKQTTLSTNGGVYRFTSLAAGNYTVSTAVQGFSAVSEAVVLTANQLFDVPLTLTVASASSTVTVTTQAALLDTSDSRFEETLNTTALTDLPLPGRNPTNVLTVAPGVTGVGRTIFSRCEYVNQFRSRKLGQRERKRARRERECPAIQTTACMSRSDWRAS